MKESRSCKTFQKDRKRFSARGNTRYGRWNDTTYQRESASSSFLVRGIRKKEPSLSSFLEFHFLKESEGQDSSNTKVPSQNDRVGAIE
jgi:hypothetical protein